MYSATAVTTAMESDIMRDFRQQIHDECQVNFICEAFRNVISSGGDIGETPLVMYYENHKIPNGGLADIVEIHGLFNHTTLQTALFRLKSDIEKWSESDKNKPSVMTQTVKTENGEISAIRFIRPKVYPFWAPHRRHY